MRVIFRADASSRIGAGHVSRCLALADELAGHGASVGFLCRDLPGHGGMSLARSGLGVRWLPPMPDSGNTAVDVQEEDARACATQLLGDAPADWLVVDHYGLDARWERAMAPYTRHLMVIDDLANRDHDCDILLDHNFVAGYGQRYAARVPTRCRLLLGPRYALFRPEFDAVRGHRAPPLPPPWRLLVSFGGSDPTGETEKALHGLMGLARRDLAIDVIVGEQNPRREGILALAAGLPGAVVHVQPGNMAEIVAAAHLAIGACGVSALERCYLGVPQLVIVVVDNQVASAAALAEAGVVVSLGASEDVEAHHIAATVADLLVQPERLAGMVAGCHALFPSDAPPGRQLITERMLAMT
jgi:UDP-2,4-diacetamido-2,4,6-trideoxy-beta-L-altropyranose hydrolase